MVVTRVFSPVISGVMGPYLQLVGANFAGFVGGGEQL